MAENIDLHDCQTFCSECKKEIFQYYSYENGYLICLKCTKGPHRTEIFTKIRGSDVMELLVRSRKWREHRRVN